MRWPAIATDLQPFALLGLLHEVETALGRKRSAPNAPRTLDLDLIDYRGRVEQGAVGLPHPRMAERRFVLEPLAEIAPGWRHPVTGQAVEALLASAWPDVDLQLIILPESGVFLYVARRDPRSGLIFCFQSSAGNLLNQKEFHGARDCRRLR